MKTDKEKTVQSLISVFRHSVAFTKPFHLWFIHYLVHSHLEAWEAYYWFIIWFKLV